MTTKIQNAIAAVSNSICLVNTDSDIDWCFRVPCMECPFNNVSHGSTISKILTENADLTTGNNSNDSR